MAAVRLVMRRWMHGAVGVRERDLSESEGRCCPGEVRDRGNCV